MENKKRKYFSDIKPVLNPKKKPPVHRTDEQAGESWDQAEEFTRPRNKISYSFDIANKNEGPIKSFNRTVDLRGMDEEIVENDKGIEEEILKKDTESVVEHKVEEKEDNIENENNNYSEKLIPENINEIETEKEEPPKSSLSGGQNFLINKLNPLKIFQNISALKKQVLLKRSFSFFILIAFFMIFAVRGMAYFNDDLTSRKGRIMDDTSVAYQYLMSGQESIMEKDYDMALYKFNIAADRFNSAQGEAGQINDSIAFILKMIPGVSVVSSGKYLLEAGANISYASKCLAQGMQSFSKTEDMFAEIKSSTNSIGGAEEEKMLVSSDKLSFTLAMANSYENFLFAQKNIEKAQDNLEKVNVKDFPEELRPQVMKVKVAMPKIRDGVDYFISHIDIILEIMGHNNPKKYLLIFQNNRELRATGGFIGTYGIFDMNEGKIENLKVEGPYNIDGQLIEKYNSPEALRLIQTRFYMRDANWFLDFPTSAEKIILLHEKAGGPTVDGVFAFTASLFEDLLDVSGSIEMADYNVTINSDNFFEKAQEEVEINYDKELNKPKKFIADLLPKIFDKISTLEKDKWSDALSVFMEGFQRKDILVYFSDEELEELSKDFGWAGEVKNPSRDYLSVVVSNIGGGKTDHVIDQKVNYHSEIQSDGSVINTVKIKRKHNGDKDNIWTHIKNMTFLRVYVPLGSTLIEAHGFDSEFFDVLLPLEEGAKDDPLLGRIEKEEVIHQPSKTRVMQESGKTVFGNYVGLEVGQEKEIALKYKLPFKVVLEDDQSMERYNLLIQKQPGTPNLTKFYGKIIYPKDFNIAWQHPSDMIMDNNSLNIETLIDADKVYAVMFGKKEIGR